MVELFGSLWQQVPVLRYVGLMGSAWFLEWELNRLYQWHSADCGATLRVWILITTPEGSGVVGNKLVNLTFFTYLTEVAVVQTV